MSLGDDSMTRMPWTGSPRLHHSWLRWQGRRLHRQPELQHQRRIPGIVLHYDAIEVYATAPPWATRLSGKPPTISEVEPTRVITRRRLLASLALTPFDGHSAMRLVGLPRFGCSVAFSNTTGLSAVRHVQPFQVVAGPATTLPSGRCNCPFGRVRTYSCSRGLLANFAGLGRRANHKGVSLSRNTLVPPLLPPLQSQP